jgi:asparagine synthase (glutamine-hydrolysing)
MCGICGIVNFSSEFPIREPVLQQMNNTLQHRGPDDEGYYIDPGQGVGLAMRRLSIIDLTTGQQPIANEDKSIWIVYNGEIYNHLEVRRRLEQKGHIFSSRSDTEAILHAYEEYGLNCVDHLNGMFAFAIWDSHRKRLFIARDRIGIKPLYYHLSNERIVFGSELKAIIANPQVPRELDLIALDQFLTLEYIPSPRTIYKNIYKLPPGFRLLVENGECHIEQYWNVKFQPIDDDLDTCIEVLTDLIRDAVKIQLMADVPLGAFLSGGIDSSSVVAFMNETSNNPVHTFSVGFQDSTYNELHYSRLVSNRFNNLGFEEYLEPDITDLALHLVSHFDEPFGDFSIFSSYLVSEVARRYVKVALSGDGGDEIFAGYDTYVAQHLDQRYYQHLPRRMRQSFLPNIIDVIPPSAAKKGIINRIKRFIEGGALSEDLQHARWMIFMRAVDKQQIYKPELLMDLLGTSPEWILDYYFREAENVDPLAQQQYVDIKTYLAEGILTKVDRMSMAVSLEVRVPLLDHRIVEFALNLPSSMKIKGYKTKHLLRQVMKSRLPKAVLNKPKEGFSIPLKNWLRGELRPLMHDLLSRDTIHRRGYFSPACVDKWIQEHVSGKVNHSHRLWALMVFELWHSQIFDSFRNPIQMTANDEIRNF